MKNFYKIIINIRDVQCVNYFSFVLYFSVAYVKFRWGKEEGKEGKRREKSKMKIPARVVVLCVLHCGRCFI